VTGYTNANGQISYALSSPDAGYYTVKATTAAFGDYSGSTTAISAEIMYDFNPY
jgi:hypothetical protein